MPEFPHTIIVPAEAAGQRLDHFLAVEMMADISRVRARQLIEQNLVLVNDASAKAALKLRGGERVTVMGPAQAPPLRAIAEEIPLDVVYEDEHLAVVNKPAGMMVHTGAGATDDARNRGTLVNALLHRFGTLSGIGGELRPGIVHRLDKDTSGLIVVAKNDAAHRKLAGQFAAREVHKTYVALVQGRLEKDAGTISSAISRDAIRRTRMTTRLYPSTRKSRVLGTPCGEGRSAVSHWKVRERIDSLYGKFTLVEVTIETGRTHQIRVHMSSIGHPVVGDTLYGATREIRKIQAPHQRALGAAARTGGSDQAGGGRGAQSAVLTPATESSRERTLARTTVMAGKATIKARRSEANSRDETVSLLLTRNFLHAAAIEFRHPVTNELLSFHSSLPPELRNFCGLLKNLPGAKAPNR